MPSKTWGTPQQINQYVVVGETEEIPAGECALVFNQDTRDHSVLGIPTWETFLAGDLTELKNRIETDIPNSEVLWMQLSWTSAVKQQRYPEYWVYGFRIEAIVRNKGTASLTGLEIVTIMIAFAFVAAVIASIVLGSWLVWRIMETVPKELVPVVGTFLLILIGVFVLLLFGITFSGKGYRVGKG